MRMKNRLNEKLVPSNQDMSRQNTYKVQKNGQSQGGPRRGLEDSRHSSVVLHESSEGAVGVEAVGRDSMLQQAKETHNVEQ